MANLLFTGDGEQLQANLQEFGRVGHIEGTDRGVNSLALTRNNILERILLIAEMERMKLEVRIDEVGNVFGIQAAANGEKDKDWVLSGSHTDSVPTGGIYDGRLGVWGALEAIRTMQEQGVKLDYPLVVGDFIAEEGARFQPAMLGSLYFTNQPDCSAEKIKAIHSLRKGEEHITFGDELKKFSDVLEAAYNVGIEINGRKVKLDQDYSKNWQKQDVEKVRAFVELHIEQGPALDAANVNVGIAQHGLGISQRLVELKGGDVAGAAMDMIGTVRSVAKFTEHSPRGTVGILDVKETKEIPPTTHQMAITTRGVSDHAGGCPMELRKDAGYAAAYIYRKVKEAMEAEHIDPARLVIGSDIKFGTKDQETGKTEGTINTVPDNVEMRLGITGEVSADSWVRIVKAAADAHKTMIAKEKISGTLQHQGVEPITSVIAEAKLSVDMRNNNRADIDFEDKQLNQILESVANLNGTTIVSNQKQRMAEAHFSKQLVEMGGVVMTELGYEQHPTFDTVGAGHDTHDINKARDKHGKPLDIPHVMVIARNRFGSHNVNEFSPFEAIQESLNVLVNMVARLGNRGLTLEHEERPAPQVFTEQLATCAFTPKLQMGRAT